MSPTAPAGKQVLAGLEIWRDDVNQKGGLLGRPVELVYYDDQGNPANAPGIYEKLMGIDKVDLLMGPYSTNVIAAASPFGPEPMTQALPCRFLNESRSSPIQLAV